MYIMDFMEAAVASAWGWDFMVILLRMNWDRPAKMGISTTPMTAQVKEKSLMYSQGVAVRSRPMNL